MNNSQPLRNLLMLFAETVTPGWRAPGRSSALRPPVAVGGEKRRLWEW